jgi:drug/metabolite transporter (DMT)-like permease
MLCLVWSSTWWVIRICLEEQPPLSSAAVRFVIAGLAMAVVTPYLRKRENAPPPPPWLWIVCGITNFGAGYGILYCAETVVPSGIAAVLWAIFPLLMAGSAVCFLGERLRGRQWLGFAVSFAGIVSVFGSDLGGIEPGNIRFAWLLLLSPVIAAIGTTLVKKYGSQTSSVVLNRNGMRL